MSPRREFAIALAREAGMIIKEHFLLGMAKEWKDDGTPLTATDTTINRLVIDRINAAYPDHDILGEEESDRSRASKYVWVCDPIDGTIPFSHGIPTCVFAIALCEDGVPVLGVIYDPFLDRMFSAEQGMGATLNGKPIRVNDRASLEHAVIAVEIIQSVTYGIGFMDALLREGAITITPTGIMYMGALVAGGELCAACYQHEKPWDGAAVKIIVEEAGGKVTSVTGEEQRYDGRINGYIASNGVLHERLVRLAQEHTLHR